MSQRVAVVRSGTSAGRRPPDRAAGDGRPAAGSMWPPTRSPPSRPMRTRCSSSGIRPGHAETASRGMRHAHAAAGARDPVRRLVGASAPAAGRTAAREAMPDLSKGSQTLPFHPQTASSSATLGVWVQWGGHSGEFMYMGTAALALPADGRQRCLAAARLAYATARRSGIDRQTHSRRFDPIVPDTPRTLRAHAISAA